jgi:hypothetical protein
MSVSIGSVVYTLCSDWMIPCKRSPLKPSPTHCNSLCFSRLHLIKNYPPAESTRQSRYLQKRTQVGSSWSSFSNKLTKVVKKSFSSCNEERKWEERVWNAAGHHQNHFLHHKLEFKSDNMAYDAYGLAPNKNKTHRQSLNKQRANNFQIPKSG